MTKLCNKCRFNKPTSEFSSDKTHSDGLSSQCRWCRGQAARARYLANPTPVKERAKAWEKANRGRANARAKAWAKANHERSKQIKRESAKRRYWADPDTARKKGVVLAKRFRTNNPQAFKAIAFRHRTKRRAQRLGSEVAPIDYYRIRRRDRMICHICGKKVESKSDLEFDHVIPLAKGGPHIEANIAVSHRRCNRRKSAKVLSLF